MHLLTPYMELTTEQSMETTEVQLGEPMSVTGVTYRNMGEELLTEAEMINRQLHHQGPHKHM